MDVDRPMEIGFCPRWGLLSCSLLTPVFSSFALLCRVRTTAGICDGSRMTALLCDSADIPVSAKLPIFSLWPQP
ncbi:hypothetical protein EV421DRAFT_1840326, partial [Armillaria borealis]